MPLGIGDQPIPHYTSDVRPKNKGLNRETLTYSIKTPDSEEQQSTSVDFERASNVASLINMFQPSNTINLRLPKSRKKRAHRSNLTLDSDSHESSCDTTQEEFTASGGETSADCQLSNTSYENVIHRHESKVTVDDVRCESRAVDRQETTRVVAEDTTSQSSLSDGNECERQLSSRSNVDNLYAIRKLFDKEMLKYHFERVVSDAKESGEELSSQSIEIDLDQVQKIVEKNKNKNPSEWIASAIREKIEQLDLEQIEPKINLTSKKNAKFKFGTREINPELFNNESSDQIDRLTHTISPKLNQRKTKLLGKCLPAKSLGVGDENVNLHIESIIEGNNKCPDQWLSSGPFAEENYSRQTKKNFEGKLMEKNRHHCKLRSNTTAADMASDIKETEICICKIITHNPELRHKLNPRLAVSNLKIDNIVREGSNQIELNSDQDISSMDQVGAKQRVYPRWFPLSSSKTGVDTPGNGNDINLNQINQDVNSDLENIQGINIPVPTINVHLFQVSQGVKDDNASDTNDTKQSQYQQLSRPLTHIKNEGLSNYSETNDGDNVESNYCFGSDAGDEFLATDEDTTIDHLIEEDSRNSSQHWFGTSEGDSLEEVTIRSHLYDQDEDDTFITEDELDQHQNGYEGSQNKNQHLFGTRKNAAMSKCSGKWDEIRKENSCSLGSNASEDGKEILTTDEFELDQQTIDRLIAEDMKSNYEHWFGSTKGETLEKATFGTDTYNESETFEESTIGSVTHNDGETNSLMTEDKFDEHKNDKYIEEDINIITQHVFGSRKGESIKESTESLNTLTHDETDNVSMEEEVDEQMINQLIEEDIKNNYEHWFGTKKDKILPKCADKDNEHNYMEKYYFTNEETKDSLNTVDDLDEHIIEQLIAEDIKHNYEHWFGCREGVRKEGLPNCLYINDVDKQVVIEDTTSKNYFQSTEREETDDVLDTLKDNALNTVNKLMKEGIKNNLDQFGQNTSNIVTQRNFHRSKVGAIDDLNRIHSLEIDLTKTKQWEDESKSEFTTQDEGIILNQNVLLANQEDTNENVFSSKYDETSQEFVESDEEVDDALIEKWVQEDIKNNYSDWYGPRTTHKSHQENSVCTTVSDTEPIHDLRGKPFEQSVDENNTNINFYLFESSNFETNREVINRKYISRLGNVDHEQNSTLIKDGIKENLFESNNGEFIESDEEVDDALIEKLVQEDIKNNYSDWYGPRTTHKSDQVDSLCTIVSDTEPMHDSNKRVEQIEQSVDENNTNIHSNLHESSNLESYKEMINCSKNIRTQIRPRVKEDNQRPTGLERIAHEEDTLFAVEDINENVCESSNGETSDEFPESDEGGDFIEVESLKEGDIANNHSDWMLPTIHHSAITVRGHGDSLCTSETDTEYLHDSNREDNQQIGEIVMKDDKPRNLHGFGSCESITIGDARSCSEETDHTNLEELIEEGNKHNYSHLLGSDTSGSNQVFSVSTETNYSVENEPLIMGYDSFGSSKVEGSVKRLIKKDIKYSHCFQSNTCDTTVDASSSLTDKNMEYGKYIDETVVNNICQNENLTTIKELQEAKREVQSIIYLDETKSTHSQQRNTPKYNTRHRKNVPYKMFRNRFRIRHRSQYFRVHEDPKPQKSHYCKGIEVKSIQQSTYIMDNAVETSQQQSNWHRLIKGVDVNCNRQGIQHLGKFDTDRTLNNDKFNSKNCSEKIIVLNELSVNMAFLSQETFFPLKRNLSYPTCLLKPKNHSICHNVGFKTISRHSICLPVPISSHHSFLESMKCVPYPSGVNSFHTHPSYQDMVTGDAGCGFPRRIHCRGQQRKQQQVPHLKGTNSFNAFIPLADVSDRKHSLSWINELGDVVKHFNTTPIIVHPAITRVDQSLSKAKDKRSIEVNERKRYAPKKVYSDVVEQWKEDTKEKELGKYGESKPLFKNKTRKPKQEVTSVQSPLPVKKKVARENKNIRFGSLTDADSSGVDGYREINDLDNNSDDYSRSSPPLRNSQSSDTSVQDEWNEVYEQVQDSKAQRRMDDDLQSTTASYGSGQQSKTNKHRSKEKPEENPNRREYREHGNSIESSRSTRSNRDGRPNDVPHVPSKNSITNLYVNPRNPAEQTSDNMLYSKEAPLELGEHKERNIQNPASRHSSPCDQGSRDIKQMHADNFSTSARDNSERNDDYQYDRKQKSNKHPHSKHNHSNKMNRSNKSPISSNIRNTSEKTEPIGNVINSKNTNRYGGESTSRRDDDGIRRHKSGKYTEADEKLIKKGNNTENISSRDSPRRVYKHKHRISETPGERSESCTRPVNDESSKYKDFNSNANRDENYKTNTDVKDARSTYNKTEKPNSRSATPRHRKEEERFHADRNKKYNNFKIDVSFVNSDEQIPSSKQNDSSLKPTQKNSKELIRRKKEDRSTNLFKERGKFAQKNMVQNETEEKLISSSSNEKRRLQNAPSTKTSASKNKFYQRLFVSPLQVSGNCTYSKPLNKPKPRITTKKSSSDSDSMIVDHTRKTDKFNKVSEKPRPKTVNRERSPGEVDERAEKEKKTFNKPRKHRYDEKIDVKYPSKKIYTVKKHKRENRTENKIKLQSVDQSDNESDVSSQTSIIKERKKNTKITKNGRYDQPYFDEKEVSIEKNKQRKQATDNRISKSIRPDKCDLYDGGNDFSIDLNNEEELVSACERNNRELDERIEEQAIKYPNRKHADRDGRADRPHSKRKLKSKNIETIRRCPSEDFDDNIEVDISKRPNKRNEHHRDGRLNRKHSSEECIDHCQSESNEARRNLRKEDDSKKNKLQLDDDRTHGGRRKVPQSVSEKRIKEPKSKPLSESIDREEDLTRDTGKNKKKSRTLKPRSENSKSGGSCKAIKNAFSVVSQKSRLKLQEMIHKTCLLSEPEHKKLLITVDQPDTPSLLPLTIRKSGVLRLKKRTKNVPLDIVVKYKKSSTRYDLQDTGVNTEPVLPKRPRRSPPVKVPPPPPPPPPPPSPPPLSPPTSDIEELDLESVQKEDVAQPEKASVLTFDESLLGVLQTGSFQDTMKQLDKPRGLLDQINLLDFKEEDPEIRDADNYFGSELTDAVKPQSNHEITTPKIQVEKCEPVSQRVKETANKYSQTDFERVVPIIESPEASTSTLPTRTHSESGRSMTSVASGGKESSGAWKKKFGKFFKKGKDVLAPKKKKSSEYALELEATTDKSPPDTALRWIDEHPKEPDVAMKGKYVPQVYSGGVVPKDIGYNLHGSFYQPPTSWNKKVLFPPPDGTLEPTDSKVRVSERKTAIDFLYSIGYTREQAAESLVDDLVHKLLHSAIREAHIWVNVIPKDQGMLLLLLATKCKDHAEVHRRYFHQLAEAIVNCRITRAMQLEGYIEVLNDYIKGRIPRAVLFDEEYEDEADEADPEVDLKKKTQELFRTVYMYTKQEAEGRRITKDSNEVKLLRVLVANYSTYLQAHLKMLAAYIAQQKIANVKQLKAAIEYLQVHKTDTIVISHFEGFCL